MLDESVEVVVESLRVTGRADQLPDRVDDDPPDSLPLDLPEEADDDPVDLELDRRRVHQVEAATLDVLDVGAEAPQGAGELHRILLEVGVEARFTAAVRARD